MVVSGSMGVVVMKFPPIEWSCLSSLGLAGDSSIGADDMGAVVVSPPPPKIVLAALKAAQTSPPPDIDEDRPGYIKAVRDILLDATDWTQASDSTLSQVEREAWASWREGVREVPGADAGSGDVPWPTPPSPNPMAVPKSATVWQVLTWLRTSKGKTLADVEEAIASIPDQATRDQATIDLRHASEFFRDDALLNSIAMAWGIDLDQAFREAAAIERVR